VEELAAYSDAAIRNAAELAEEASLLAANKHFARAYFLAVASIEETGKAILLFDAGGRNLKDPAVFSRLIKAWSDHGEKITSAFVPWLATDREAIRRNVMRLNDLMVALRNGREPAMYSDIRSDNHRPQLPSEVVRPSAAQDCVRLAIDCLTNARHHLKTRAPTQYTRDQDKLFALPRTQYHRLMNNPDFWWYFVVEMEAGRKDFAAAVISYRDQFELAKRKFRAAEET
jgi:AbiV family abortive infection protein